jgi:uncharacterized membrane protein (DUF2068 family)
MDPSNTVAPTVATTAAKPTGLRLIISYKFAKAALELIAGASFFMLGSSGATERIVHLAQALRHHATETWSIALAEALLNASTGRHVLVVALAAIADGIVSAIEGWALYHGYSWSHWLVMLTTASLLPFEIIALTRHVNAGRVTLFVVNLVIVLYLLRHLRARKAQPPP